MQTHTLLWKAAHLCWLTYELNDTPIVMLKGHCTFKKLQDVQKTHFLSNGKIHKHPWYYTSHNAPWYSLLISIYVLIVWLMSQSFKVSAPIILHRFSVQKRDMSSLIASSRLFSLKFECLSTVIQYSCLKFMCKIKGVPLYSLRKQPWSLLLCFILSSHKSQIIISSSLDNDLLSCHNGINECIIMW